MKAFREHLPHKTGTVGQFATYGLYKQVLKADFHSRCGYCNDSHVMMGGWRGMQIDHFVPQVPYFQLENDYNNLVYSCFYCNNAKSNDWATTDMNTPINAAGNAGYVHPRTPAYDALFVRNFSGSIIPNNPLAFYIYTNLNLGLKRHDLLYTIDKLRLIIDNITVVLEGNLLDQAQKVVIEKNLAIFHKVKHKYENQFIKIIDAR